MVGAGITAGVLSPSIVRFMFVVFVLSGHIIIMKLSNQ